MKIADVTYEGPMRSHNYRCGNSGNRYTFKRGREVPIDHLEDVKEFASHPNTFDIDWTVHGMLLRETDGSLDQARDKIEEFGYRQKQKLAKSFGINASQTSEELEEELQDQVESLKRELENQ